MARVRWSPSHRLVASRFPTVSLYDRVARPEDLEAVFAIEALTNPRLRQEAGEISLVPVEERVSGRGTSPIMAAFTHLNPEGSRFSDGTWGVYYAAHAIETALRESAHHRAIFLARTREAACEIDMRCYLADVDAELTDIRRRGSRRFASLHDPASYAASQRFARTERAKGAFGICYDSVRHPGGQCVALFKPRALKPAREGPHFAFVWDGKSVVGWYEKRSFRGV